MVYSGDWGKLIHEKKSRKSRDTVPLKNAERQLILSYWTLTFFCFRLKKKMFFPIVKIQNYELLLILFVSFSILIGQQDYLTLFVSLWYYQVFKKTVRYPMLLPSFGIASILTSFKMKQFVLLCFCLYLVQTSSICFANIICGKNFISFASILPSLNITNLFRFAIAWFWYSQVHFASLMWSLAIITFISLRYC